MARLCELLYELWRSICRTDQSQGIFWGFVIFNFLAVFVFSWLYLHGVRDLKRWFSARKTQKSRGGTRDDPLHGKDF